MQVICFRLNKAIYLITLEIKQETLLYDITVSSNNQSASFFCSKPLLERHWFKCLITLIVSLEVSVQPQSFSTIAQQYI